jgi:hypothetical protein
MRYLGQDETPHVSGIGYFGEVAQGPDGMLYQWVEGVDGLGNPIGFWKKLRTLGRRLVKTALPLAQRLAPFVPGVGPVAATALRHAAPVLQKAGLVGIDGLGALYQASDGSMYRMEGVGAPDDLNGYLADDELHGFAADDLDGLDAADELSGDELTGDDELRGLSDEDALRGLAAEDLSSVDASDDVSGFAAGEDLQGEDLQGEDLQGLEQGYVRGDGGVHAVEAYVPQQAPATRFFTEPAQSPALWKPLW